VKRFAVVRGAVTLMKSFPAAFPVCPRVSKTMNALIPVYNADGSLHAWASEQRFARLQSAGLVARVVRSRKGQVRRAILFRRPDESKLRTAGSVMGICYSYEERLEHGRPWKLKKLGGSHYAPTSFQQVVADCLPASAETLAGSADASRR
jgi:hypothetical protein